MDDYPRRRYTPASSSGPAVSMPIRAIDPRRPSGAVTRPCSACACTRRARRLAGALAALGVGDNCKPIRHAVVEPEKRQPPSCTSRSRRWARSSIPSTPRRLRIYGVIVDDAQDRVIVVDESLLETRSASLERSRFRSCHRRLPHLAQAAANACMPTESLVADAVSRSDGWRTGRASRGGECRLHLLLDPPDGRRGLGLHRQPLWICRRGPCHELAVSGQGHDPAGRAECMFHANAWGLPYAAALAGAGLVLPALGAPCTESVLELCAAERGHHDGGSSHRVDGDAGQHSTPNRVGGHVGHGNWLIVGGAASGPRRRCLEGLNCRAATALRPGVGDDRRPRRGWARAPGRRRATLDRRSADGTDRVHRASRATPPARSSTSA